MITKKKITKAARSAVTASAAAALTKKVQAVFYRLPGIGGKPGKEVVRDWLRSDVLTDEDRKRTGTDIRHVEWRHPVGMPRIRAMGDGLAELRSAVPSGHEIRLLFIVHGGEMVVLHGFIKTTKTTPKGDLDLARDRQKDWKKNSP